MKICQITAHVRVFSAEGIDPVLEATKLCSNWESSFFFAPKLGTAPEELLREVHHARGRLLMSLCDTLAYQLSSNEHTAEIWFEFSEKEDLEVPIHVEATIDLAPPTPAKETP